MYGKLSYISKISLNSNQIEKFKIKEVMDCDSRNLLYCIVCSGCGEKYIGKMGDILRNRVRVHKQQILHEDKRMFGMSDHFSKCSQNYSPNFKINPFFKIKSDNEDFRKNMESHFIRRLKPKLNKLTISSKHPNDFMYFTCYTGIRHLKLTFDCYRLLW